LGPRSSGQQKKADEQKTSTTDNNVSCNTKPLWLRNV